MVKHNNVTSVTNTSDSADRVVWIDLLRLLSCFGVVLIHVSGEAYSRFSPSPSSEWWLANIVNGSCRAAVPIFVMISGALIKESDCDSLHFYRKKALRFLPVILAWTTLYGVFDVIVMGYTIQEVTIQFLSRGYVYLHLWYLSMFACLLVFTPYLARLRFGLPYSECEWRHLVAVSIAFVFIDWFLLFLCHALGLEFSYWTRTFLLYIPYFLLGAWLSVPKSKAKCSLWGLILALALFASWGANYITCRFLGVVCDWMPLSNHSPLVLAVAVTTFILARSVGELSMKSSFWMSVSSEATLGVYLLHPFVMWLVQRLLRETHFDILSGWWMLLSAIVVFTISVSIILLVRRFPLGRKIC